MFSLLDEPWIQVVDTHGTQRAVGIKDIFSGEAQAVEIRGESPAQNYAVTRLLLAIFWRAHAPESHVEAGQTFNFADWFRRTRKKLQKTGRDDVALEYLERYRDRFELFDDKAPFMQVAGLHVPSGETKPVTLIVPEAQENYFSMRAGAGRETLTFAEGARWLVYVQAFDYSGIKSGLVGDTRVKGGKGYPIGTGWSGMTGGTLIVGENLLDTLALNTVQEALTSEDDRPVWERKPDNPDARSTKSEAETPQGPADIATWQSRRILLQTDGQAVISVTLGNGDPIPGAGANIFADPMTPYRYSRNKSKKNLDVYYPRPYDVERTMWRALDSLVVAETDTGFSAKDKAPKRPRTLDNLAEMSQVIDGIPPVLDVHLVSVEYGTQSASVSTTFGAQIQMPLILLMQKSQFLREQVRSAAQAASEAATSLGRFAGNLLVAGGNEYLFNSAVTDRVLAELEPLFNQWLRRLEQLPATAAENENEQVLTLIRDWQHSANDLIMDHARILLRGAGPRAFNGRVLPSSSEDSAGRFVSAATYYQQLQRSLHTIFSTIYSDAPSNK